MIEIVGEPREATPEELEKFEEKSQKECVDWRQAMLRTFLAGN